MTLPERPQRSHWKFNTKYTSKYAEPTQIDIQHMLGSRRIDLPVLIGPTSGDQNCAHLSGLKSIFFNNNRCAGVLQVESQKGKSVEVYFVDFGNTDRVDSTSVVGLPAEFGSLPTQVRYEANLFYDLKTL